jgi:hypothetical protein
MYTLLESYGTKFSVSIGDNKCASMHHTRDRLSAHHFSELREGVQTQRARRQWNFYKVDILSFSLHYQMLDPAFIIGLG